MYQFSFLPYFPANNIDLTVNRLHLFNLWQAGASYIEDPAVRARVERIANIYVSKDLKPLNQMTIAVLDQSYAMKPLDDPQINDLKNYVLALLFCSILKNDNRAGHINSTCTSEHFTLFHQNFNLEGEFISYATGSYYRVENVNTLGQTQLVKPDYVGDVLTHRYDRELFEALCNLIDQNNPDDNFIFAVLDWMRFAFLNSDGYNYASRVVMVATAYEVLFSLPDFNKVDTFAGAIEILLQTERMDGRGLPKLKKQNALGKEKENTVYGWWARDFYHLRSQIVHGSVLPREVFFNHNNIEHFVAATKIMQFCLYKILENKGYLTYEADTILGNVRKTLTENRLRKVEKLIA